MAQPDKPWSYPQALSTRFDQLAFRLTGNPENPHMAELWGKDSNRVWFLIESKTMRLHEMQMWPQLTQEERETAMHQLFFGPHEEWSLLPFPGA